LHAIERAFAEYFRRWKLTLPHEDVRLRRAGFLTKAGWLVQYCFGNDARGEYVDFYACHRMTDDSHHRIRVDGSMEVLPALQARFLLPADPKEQKKAERAFVRENREIARMLVAKGFNRFTMQMWLVTDLGEEIVALDKESSES
jgi:hypothetical protein